MTDAHLAGLRADGVGYLFAGEDDLDRAMRALREELGIEHFLFEGGGASMAPCCVPGWLMKSA
ncbi:hypothetical protein [Sphingomonas sp. GC_Shp_3]|uniref:hypothetical protein n=1 Tax=Sphingomonas sp. GC_Shp_3 TaxID=2937383 RepID=UPI002269B43E|nr:hypothetical protein [Sphingomonas sp. GC_Shp_3]